MDNVINIIGVIGEIPDDNGNIITPNSTFLNVVSQVEAYNEPAFLNFIIKSPGGYVEDGDEIYNYIESLKDRGIQVNTYAKEVCASIATKIFLAGEQRLLIGQPDFMIHNPFGSLEGDADEIESYYKSLRALENDLINFYADKTGTSKEAIKPLMKKETTLTNQEAIQLGFATGNYQNTELKAVAYFKKYNLKNNQMSKDVLTKKEAESMFDKLSNKIKAFLDTKIKNKMVIDSTGAEIDFPDVEDDSTPAIGDAATVEGVAAEGEYLMPNGDAYVFNAGVLTEIRVAEPDATAADPDEIANFEQQIENLLQEVANGQSEVKNLKKQNKKFKGHLEVMSEQVKVLSKSMGSDFKHDPKKKNLKLEKSTVRKLLKDA